MLVNLAHHYLKVKSKWLRHREVKNRERLAAVTEKLNKIEAERAWNMSKEGKAANKELKEAATPAQETTGNL